MARINEVFGIHPSNSGNTRVLITFYNAGDMNFYMKPDGSLHFPKTHNEFTLQDPLDGYNEFLWVEKTWKKGNKEVVKEELSGDKRKKAVALCTKLMDPKERKKVITDALIKQSGSETLRRQLGNKVFRDAKKAIVGEKASKTPVKPETVKQAVILPIETVIKDAVPKNFNPEHPQIKKFEKKYAGLKN